MAAATSPALSSLSMEEKSQGPFASPVLPELTSGNDHDEHPEAFKPTFGFWMVFLALSMALSLQALDLTAVSTILPTIADEFQTSKAYWTGAAFALTSASLMTFAGSFYALWGRKAVTVAAVIVFMVGSAVTGSARSFNSVIIGRAIQGAGGGAISVGVEIILTDLCPPAVRGQYFGIIAFVWAMASVMGPPISGALGSAGQWRWLFYLNLPICAIAIPLVLRYMNISTPKRSVREKIVMLNANNLLFVASSTGVTLSLSWAGPVYTWDSAQVLVPLILGTFGLVAFFSLERYVKHPTIPVEVFGNYTSCVGYLTVMVHTLCVMAIVFFLPIYYQAVQGATPVKSGVDLLPLAFSIAPFAIVGGIYITVVKYYKSTNVLGWALTAIGLGPMYLIKVDSAPGMWKALPIVSGVGMGLVFAGNQFPVIAPLRPSIQPQAMVVLAFFRSIGCCLGLAVSQAIVQNKMQQELPSSIVEPFGSVQNIIYAAVPLIKSMPEPARQMMRVAFAESIARVWLFLGILGAVTCVIACAMKNLELNMETDDTYALERDDDEKRSETAANKSLA